MTPTPKEKAQELIKKFTFASIYFADKEDGARKNAKQCALIAVDEIIRIETHHVHHKWVEYWKEVKNEIYNF